MPYEFYIIFFIAITVFIGFLFTFPRYSEQDDADMLQKYLKIKEDLLSVMTFNIRLDGFERNPNNHFTKRIYRLIETIEKWQPVILCLQEPLTKQLQQWQSHLPKYYQSIGYQRGCIDECEKDFQVAILYDNQKLKLIDRDYIWLSKTPRIVGSKDWESNKARTLNIARFELISSNNSMNVLVFNTHLDVKSELARREQAKIIRSTINQWQKKYPTDIVLLFGDFNTIPQQMTYRILTSENFLYDTWTMCKSHLSECISNSFSSTFHGWLGSIANTYGFQIIQGILYTFRGIGIDVPYSLSMHFSFYVNLVRELIEYRRMIKFPEIKSLWSSHRFHVDWILYQNSIDGNIELQPRFVSVIDIRSRNYSSDHFPLVAAFQIKKDD